MAMPVAPRGGRAGDELFDNRIGRPVCRQAVRARKPERVGSLVPVFVQEDRRTLNDFHRLMFVESVEPFLHQRKGLILAQNERWRRG